MPPLVSVVVPVYNVEPYLRATLQSIADQTVGELEVVVVDDGSTDGSLGIAEEFARDDARFRVLHQANGGLGNARNNGADAARSGEFLGFVDGDDVLPRNAYELLLDALGRSGSDFATGNVHRVTEGGLTSQAPFLARAFAENRLATHVTRFRPLLEDRIVPNKLWRRSFWDTQGYRFPEGMLHEDIPVVVPAQFAARSVDVIADPVYLYRVRESADLSITQRRAEKRALLDRVRAVSMVLAHFDASGMRRARRWYERSIVAHDLSYYLNVLDIADDEYRALFLERVNELLDGARDRGLYRDLLAIDRLKWHLMRRRLVPELLEVLRFQKERLHDTPPVRLRGRWYGDYPFRGDRRLRVPHSVYRLGRELSLVPHLDSVFWDGEAVRVEGYASIRLLGAPSPGSQRVSLSLLRPGRLRALRQRLTPLRMKTSAVERPEATAGVRDSWCDATWSGFAASLDARQLRREGRWELYITVRSRGVTRRRARFAVDGTRAIRAASRTVRGDLRVTAAPASVGQVVVRAESEWASIRAHSLVDGVVDLSGELSSRSGGDLALQLVGSGGSGALEYPLEVSASAFRVRVPLADIAEAVAWDLYLVAGRSRRRVTIDAGVIEAVSPGDGRELLLMRTRAGHAVLSGRVGGALATGARWTGDGALELEGSGDRELSLRSRDHLERHVFFGRVQPARVPTLGGELPLRAGEWDLYAGDAPLLLSQTLYDQLPLETVVDGKRFALGMTGEQRAFLSVGPDLRADEQGRFHQRRLRETAYVARRSEPLREAVVYSSFGGRQYSDSPRAIHEELVRRDAPLEHLWVVRDGMCRVPESAQVLREGSREYYQALAQARFVVTNESLPRWFAARPDQVCVRASDGTPLARPETGGAWGYVVSPNRFSTPMLAAAYEGEVLETGLPRVDMLFRGSSVRERLGVSDGRRLVLYAPTYRDGVVDSQGRHRLDLHLDLERLRASVGENTVLLFRKHHLIADTVPESGFVRDVSAYPDATELLRTADVLVTDYSSIMFDFANTRRPMLFFAYDLDAQRDAFEFDFEQTVPGPVLRTTDELAEALRDLPPIDRSRYEKFVSTFCEFDDGHASARVVDRVFQL